MNQKDMTCMQCGTKKNTIFIDECGFALCQTDIKGTDYDPANKKVRVKINIRCIILIQVLQIKYLKFIK